MTYSKLSSDSMHNQNCHAYLLQLKSHVNQVIVKHFPELGELNSLTTAYNPQVPYGDLYSKIITSLEDDIDEIYSILEKENNKEDMEGLNRLIYAIYHNDNHILEQAHWLNDLNLSVRPQNAHKLQEKIVKHLKDEATPVNQMTPQKAETQWRRMNVLYNFKPQHETNIPSVRHYEYDSNSARHEYRMSTQAQRHHGSVRISPLFKRWLKVQALETPGKKIAHIYFNNLTLNTTSLFDIPATNEKRLSQELHKLEDDPSLKVAVITLPASKGLLGIHDYQITRNKIPYVTVFEELFTVARSEFHPSKITDFKISEAVRKQLWPNPGEDEAVLKRLLQRSFAAMGFEKENSTLSTAQKQAVWFHFIKMELPDFILTTLDPNGYNFSCKDAIDRGLVSSIYLHLMKSFSSDKPMQQKEYERELDAVAAMVKGRGLNFHRQVIWNAIDTYVHAHHNELIQDEKKSWLIFWRDMNCPHARVEQLLALRINECTALLKSIPNPPASNPGDKPTPSLKDLGLKLLDSIKIQQEQGVSGQRLLLEVVARTSNLLVAPKIHDLEAYTNLAQELEIKYPALTFLAGLMKAFVGCVLFVLSAGQKTSTIKEGLATAKAGFFAHQRKEVSKNIEEFSEEFSKEIGPKFSD